MAVSISAVLIPCLESFNLLVERVRRPGYAHEDEVPRTSWADELGRIRIWAANIGAHQTGQSSLEFRLRDASHISRQIIKLINDLKRSIDDTGIVLSEVEEAHSSPATSPADPLHNEATTTELQDIHEEIVTIINCLFKMSMLIRRPAQHDVILGSHASDTAAFEPFDKEHVRNKYPKADLIIVERLGRGITRRRKHLKYRERHREKLGKGIDSNEEVEGVTTDSQLSETIATEFKTQHIDFEETPSDSGLSQTSYASSLIDSGTITIPPPPRKSVLGAPFECPYCFFIISIRSTRSWTKHVFKDIKPYICSLTNCPTSDKLYDSRREWFSHEATAHPGGDFLCTLCKDHLSSPKQYERHVARHLEEIALFALPVNETEEVEERELAEMESGSDTDGSEVREVRNKDEAAEVVQKRYEAEMDKLTKENMEFDEAMELWPRSVKGALDLSNSSGHNPECALERDEHYDALDLEYKRLHVEKVSLLEGRGIIEEEGLERQIAEIDVQRAILKTELRALGRSVGLG